MASPLNIFKSISANVTTETNNVYQCPDETTTIVLLAQVANLHPTEEANVTFYALTNDAIGANLESSAPVITLVKDFTIPPRDAAGMLTGKLVIESGERLGIYADANNKLMLTLSILETK